MSGAAEPEFMGEVENFKMEDESAKTATAAALGSKKRSIDSDACSAADSAQDNYSGAADTSSSSNNSNSNSSNSNSSSNNTTAGTSSISGAKNPASSGITARVYDGVQSGSPSSKKPEPKRAAVESSSGEVLSLQNRRISCISFISSQYSMCNLQLNLNYFDIYISK